MWRILCWVIILKWKKWSNLCTALSFQCKLLALIGKKCLILMDWYFPFHILKGWSVDMESIWCIRNGLLWDFLGAISKRLQSCNMFSMFVCFFFFWILLEILVLSVHYASSERVHMASLWCIRNILGDFLKHISKRLESCNMLCMFLISLSFWSLYVAYCYILISLFSSFKGFFFLTKKQGKKKFSRFLSVILLWL